MGDHIVKIGVELLIHSLSIDEYKEEITLENTEQAGKNFDRHLSNSVMLRPWYEEHHLYLRCL